MLDRSAASFHMINTPRTPVRSSGGFRRSDSPPAEGDTCADIVDALTYYYESTLSMDLGTDSEVALTLRSEIVSLWKYLIELFRMEALNERLSELDTSMDDSPGLLRTAFQKYPSFRKLLATLRWQHWINQQVGGPEITLSPSSDAYPSSSPGLPIDAPLTCAEKVSAADTQRELQLCRDVWRLLSQGRVGDAMRLSSSCGHHWRAGVLNAACGHDAIREAMYTRKERDVDVDPDWVECEVSAGIFGFINSEKNEARWNVKKTARVLLERERIGVSEFDTAFMGYLCGDADAMCETGANPFWISLVVLRDQFAAWVVGEGELEGGDIDEFLERRISESFISNSSDFTNLSRFIISGSWESAIKFMIEKWITEGVVSVNQKNPVNIDLYSPRVAVVPLILIRSFLCSFVTLLVDLDERDKRPGDRIQAGSELVSTAVVAHVECLVGQYKASGELVANCGLVVDTIGLLRRDAEDHPTRIDLWTKYLSGMSGEWDWDQSVLGFAPLVALLETFSEGSVEVVRRAVEGSSVRFGSGLVYAYWLLVQSAAKSSGNGIYLGIIGGDNSEKAAEQLVGELSRVMADVALAALSRGELELAKSVMAFANEKYGKFLSLKIASETIDSDPLSVVSSIIGILDRALLVQERNSLLEQQQAQLVIVSGRATGTRSGVMSTDSRRHAMDIKRLIDSTGDMIQKVNGEMVHGLAEMIEDEWCGLNETHSSVIDGMLEAVVDAIRVSGDVQQEDQLVRLFRQHDWLDSTVAPQLVRMIMSRD
jgi:hypothetical protein